MDRADVIIGLAIGLPLAGHVLAVWIGMRGYARFGWLAQAGACLLPPAAAFALLCGLIMQTSPCPPGADLSCGEASMSLLFGGLACMAANLVFAIPPQIVVWGWLRARSVPKAGGDTGQSP